MKFARIAAVTGANKGIGYAIVRNIALKYSKSPLNTGPLLIYLTARNKSRGENAVASIMEDAELRNALVQHGGLTEVKFHPLDITNQSSIDGFVSFLKRNHPDGIDVVINNAGILRDDFDLHTVKDTLASNYYGTLNATKALLPIIREHGRLVNMSSLMARLSLYPDTIATKFRTATSIAEVNSLVEEYVSAVAGGRHERDGWPNSSYAVSKAGVTSITKVFAAEERAKHSSVLINSCCPGYVATDLTKGAGWRKPDHGAKTPVMLALEDIGGRSGKFWQNGRVRNW
ncbi:carbonyl reductase [Patellaria atrata CBS 101060]|uniref:Carbonyl reductase n=1 Tax=Patellaria atrata CBS 101060 TaxID=1346257 RepID=A0A9P4VMU6_9PEZI|nr:carbonyl reductase [Patellaria atrata CBS 101060]